MPARSIRLVVYFFPLFLFISFPGRGAVEEVEKLAYLGKIWGFLKYHHPQVAKGNLNWDSVLIQAIPRVKAAKNKKEYNLALETLLKAAGQAPAPQTSNDKSEDLKINLDLSWLENNNLLTKTVSERLVAVKEGFVPQANFFVSNGYQEEQTGQPVFLNEKTYENMSAPNEAYRLLALFRYWNAVDYFYIHKYLIGADWEEILLQFIPKFQQAADPLAYQLALVELTATLNDAQAGAFSPLLREYFGQYSLPFRVSYLEGEMVITKILSNSVATAANIKIGDILLAIDEQETEDLRKQYVRYTGNPNPDARQHLLNQKVMMGKTINPVTLLLKRGSEKFTARLDRYRVETLYNWQRKQTPIERPWRLIREKEAAFGYLNGANLTIDQIVPAFNDFQNTQGLIIDLRSFLFTPLVYDLIAQLYDQKTDFVKLVDADTHYPGTLTYYDPDKLRKPNAPLFYKSKIVVLVNEHTFGLAELTALALQKTPSATVLGSQTAGAYGNVSSLIVPGGVMVTFTGQGAFYPNGPSLQRQGVKVDVEIKPTINSIQKGHDELIERGIRYLRKGY